MLRLKYFLIFFFIFLGCWKYGVAETPTIMPTFAPSEVPTIELTPIPTANPTVTPTATPTKIPTNPPSYIQTDSPSDLPTPPPTVLPSLIPTRSPSETPTVAPTETPSTAPSFLPSEAPTEIPSFTPSEVPTASPTYFPSHFPSSQPTAVPSRRPSIAPTSRPSRIPTTHPSDHPTGQPSNPPSSQPTGQPVSSPSMLPSAQPTNIPSSQPIALPSSYPSSQPIGLPTAAPSSQPSLIPSSMPSSAPTAVPIGKPTGQPSGLPTGNPTRQPTSEPTSEPSKSPLAKPSLVPNAAPTGSPITSKPTKQPSSDPTGQPSKLPTSTPSSQPTSLPTTQPSGVPSIMPSSVPSAQPISLPSSLPTGLPTSVPSTAPSCLPSSQPTTLPSSQPTRIPTSQPTSLPTTRDSPRYFTCDETLTCESNSLENCSFFTGAIVLECTAASNNCLFNVGSFAIGPDTELNVTGNCSLTVFATSQINIYEDVVIRGNAINFTSAGPVSVAGTVMTSGRGPSYGPGFAANIGIGAGGSYGGSGGKNSCNKTSFSVVDYQIGSVHVSTDLRQPDEFNPTYGSGGGKFGGRGGGRILLNSANVITVQEQGKLLAEGSEALATGYGAGSGGGILIRAYSFYNYGTISVQGGASNVHGGGGGGGRISLEVISDQDISNSQILKANIAGGKVGSINELTQRPQCLSGGAGTISFQPSMGTTVQNLFAFTFNEGSKTQAGTPLSFLPSTTLKFTSSRVNLIGSSFHLKSQGTCDSDQSTAVTSPLCSSISLINSTLHCQNQTLVFIYDYYHTFNLRSCGLIADIVSLNSSLLNIYASDGFYGSGKLFTLSSDSKIDFGTYAFLNSTKNIELYGEVRQVPSRSYRGVSKPTFRIDSEGNVTVQTILADKVIISGRNIKILPKANLETMSKSPSNCINSVNATLTACTLPEVSLFNSIKWFQAEKEITAETGFRVSAAMISMCADSIKFSGNTTIFADGLGCSANNGTGTGGSAVFGVAGGAGGAYSGNGGYGYNNLNYGQSYDSSGILSSGSGGGCSAPTKSDCYEGSSGGGIINFYASKSIALNANVSTAGIAGSYCGGGGAGGGISLVTSTLTGTGSVKANGGMGGTCAQPGGGGGGGFIQIYSPNPSGDYSSYKFYGSIVSLGGLPGVTTAVNPASMSNNYVSKVLPLLSVHIASIQAATSGSNGVIGVPNCEAGYGSNPTDGKICSVCPTGTWSPGGTSDCLQCTNAPSHSSYIDEQVTTSNCPYECDSGYSTNSCLNQLQLFIYNTLTLGGLAGVCVGILALIFVPLLYYRYKRHNDWGDKKADQGDFFSKVMFFGADLGFGADDPMNKSRGVSGKLNYTENPLSLKSSTAIDDIEDIKVVAIRKLQPKRGKEMRREHRMADQDMIFHACRVNLYGQNHPHQSRGGPWIMSNKRPNCLKPTLKKREYQELAERINNAVSWNQYGSEMMIFYLLSFLIPPLSAYIMKGYRRRRAAILMNVIANYDYSCFRCPEQRRSKNSLRIGISPDATLAYIDFLFDDEAYSKKTKPLCPLGQAKLPAAFRFAGLGTYHAPFYVDTNDLILQAVPQTDVASAFIDGAWINFVVELNTILRTLQTDALYEGIVSVIKFLSDSKNSQNLGGLIIEFCTFNNIPKIEEREVMDPTADQVVVDQRESNTIGKQETGRAISNSDPLAAPFEPDRTSYEEKTTRLFSVETWFKSLQRKPTTDRDRRTLNRSTKTGMSTSDKASMSFRPGGDTLFQKKSEASSTDSNLYFIARCMKSILNFILCRRKQNDHVEDFDLPSQKESEVGVKVRDPSGVERIMSFPEILSAIRKGDVTMGIVVSHPKVLGDVYIAKDEDYESGDDLDDDLISEDVGLPTAAELKRSFSDDTESSGYQKTTSLDTLEDPLFRAYGSKAEQMAKFYRIMQQSEKEPSDFSMAASPSSDRKLEIYEIASSPAAVAIPIDFEGSDPFQKKLSTEDSPKETPPILTREQRRASLGPLKSTEQPTDTYTEFSQARGSVAGEDARPMSVDITKFPRQESRVVEDEAGLSSFERLGRPMSRPLSRRDEGSTEDLQELQKAILTSSSAGTSRPASVGIHTEPSPKDLISALDLSEKESPSKKDGDKSPPPPLSQSPTNNFSHSPKSEKVNITSPPSTKETNQLRSKSRKRPKKTKLNMPLHNLAPSCFQHFAKAWRFTINEYEPTTDGKLGPKYIRTIVNLDEDDEDEPEIAAKKGALDVESQPVVGGGLIKDSNNSSRNSSQHRRSGNYSRDSYRDNRESFFHTLMQISFTENQKRGFGGATGTGGANVAPSSDPNNPRVSSYRKSEAAETRTIRSINSMNFSSMNNSGIFGNLWLQKQFQYLYYNGFFLHYFTRFMFGCNVYPYGPKNFRKLFELVAFILCIADLTLWVLMLINTSCVSSNTTACNDQTALIVVICVWPLAFLVAPLMGITAILLGPSGALARHYALWSRLAAMNNGLMLFITFKYLDYYYNVTGGIYFVIVVTSSRVFQCQLVDYYVAHIERLRYTRGWDGLSTSLFKTKDNKKEIGL